MPEPIPPIREYEAFNGRVSDACLKQCQEFALSHQQDENGNNRPLLRWRKGKLIAQNYVGILPIGDSVIEILPKLELTEDEDKEREIFCNMLRHWRGLKFAELKQTDIEKTKKFNMWEVFIHLFLQQTLHLIKRGIVSHYHEHEDNLPYLKGRLQFPHHAVINVANKARFYSRYDVYSPNHAANRLIRTTLDSLSCRQVKNQRLRQQLINHFDDVPPSKNIQSDWQHHHVNRSMQHYQPVMQWVGLFLFKHGLTTFSGDYQNKSLLFPMEEVFEDFVAHHFRRHATDYKVRCQSPQKYMATLQRQDNDKPMFKMIPDISLCDANNGKVVILDTKWTRLNSEDGGNKYGISQQDMYQLFAYGKLYDNCHKVILIYPQSKKFNQPLHYHFNDSNKLSLSCYPFDITNPKDSVDKILSGRA